MLCYNIYHILASIWDSGVIDEQCNLEKPFYCPVIRCVVLFCICYILKPITKHQFDEIIQIDKEL